MSDEWDDIILHRDIPASAKVNSAPALYSDAIPSIQAVVTKVPKAKEITKSIPKKELPPVRAVTAQAGEKIAASVVTQKAIFPSPYVSKLPAIWSANLANKFATLALALVITFGVYSFGIYIANFGLEKTIAMTADSMSQAASAIAPFLKF